MLDCAPLLSADDLLAVSAVPVAPSVVVGDGGVRRGALTWLPPFILNFVFILLFIGRSDDGCSNGGEHL